MALKQITSFQSIWKRSQSEHVIIDLKDLNLNVVDEPHTSRVVLRLLTYVKLIALWINGKDGVVLSVPQEIKLIPFVRLELTEKLMAAVIILQLQLFASLSQVPSFKHLKVVLEVIEDGFRSWAIRRKVRK